MSEVSTLQNSTADQDNHSPSKASPKGSPVAKGSRKKELPPQWEKVISEQHGRYYYWNKETGKTTWKFPEEDAKQHHQMVRSHKYMNVELSPKKRPEKSPRKLSDKFVPSNGHTDSSTDNGSPSNQGEPNSTSVGVANGDAITSSCNGDHLKTETRKPRTSSQSSYVNVEFKNGGSPVLREPGTPASPVPAESRFCFTRTDSDCSSTLSPTPPLPSRNYSESDLSLSPPPPLPDRGSFSSPGGKFFPEGPAAGSQGQRSKGQNNRKTGHVIEHTMSVEGYEYAVVNRGHGVQETPESPTVTSPPPPLPLRAHQRLAQDAQEAGYPEIAERAAQRSRDRGYSEIEPRRSVTRLSPKPVAYAVVDLSRDERSPMPESPPTGRVLTPPRPRPYEVPSASMENLTDVGYDQVKANEEEAVEEDGAGYAKVKRMSMQRSSSQEQQVEEDPDGYAKVKRVSVQRSSSQEQQVEEDGAGYAKVKRMSLQRSSSQEQQDKRRPAHKEYYSIPTTAKDSVANPLTRRDSPSAGRDSPLSQDSELDSEHQYNRLQLQRLNVTLGRSASSTPHLSGYSRLGEFSKEAILLRSGVTLRRYGRLDSVASSVSRPEDKSEESASGSDQDDGLEPVNKAIKSLESSLGVSADDLGEPAVEMVKVPDGPPTWTKVQRRPHAYERMGDSPENDLESTNQDAGKHHMTATSSLEMDWDETEFGEPKTGSSRGRELSKGISSSQPNLLRDSAGEFPHLKRPSRVSQEAFQMRMNRLKGHKYEDVVDGGEGPAVLVHSTESVGDVNALNSALKESWLEGDQRAGQGAELPKGWRSLKDEHDRVYYWHVPTGRTQYEKPDGEGVKRLSLSVDDRFSVERASPHAERERKRRPHPTFKAHLIGSLDVDESELVQGQCVKVVHFCISKVNSEPDTVLASDKDQVVYLQVHNANLRWLDPATSSPTLTQPINKIRVWGIGLENDKDFGYVARDVSTKKHLCHIFRCERPARAVARALLEAHQRERQERRAKKALRKNQESLASSGEQAANSPASTRDKPTSTAHKQHCERITCHYMGSCDVFQSQGMQVVNEAVGKLCADPGYQLTEVHVDVATSSVRILDAKTEAVIAEHRVRFLCFLGIAKDDHYCGYILDSGTRNDVKQLKFYGFCMEPNTDRLCLAVHRACQARYQRVLESNPEARKHAASTREEHSSPPSKTKSTPNLFDRLGSLRKTKKSPVDDDTPHESFVVQYLGCQGVSKPEGLEAVRVPLQQMALPKTQSSANPPFLVDFDVAPAGIFLSDPQKQVFNKKMFSVKNITYVVRVRNYFAFIVRDVGKFNCHVFVENEVDAGTIVSTVERVLSPDSLKSPAK